MSPAEVVRTVDVAAIHVTSSRGVQLSLTRAAAQAGHVPSATHCRQIVPIRYHHATSGTRGLITACDTVVSIRIHPRMWRLKISHRQKVAWPDKIA